MGLLIKWSKSNFPCGKNIYTSCNDFRHTHTKYEIRDTFQAKHFFRATLLMLLLFRCNAHFLFGTFFAIQVLLFCISFWRTTLRTQNNLHTYEKVCAFFDTSIEFSHENCYPFLCREMEVIYCYMDIVDSKIESRNRQSVEVKPSTWHKHILWYRICICRLVTGLVARVCARARIVRLWRNGEKVPTRFLSHSTAGMLQASHAFFGYTTFPLRLKAYFSSAFFM